jgi:hypothetical protein
MRRLSGFALCILVVSVSGTSALHAEKKPDVVRVCVARLKNSTPHIVNEIWQRDQLVKAFERINKGKNVKKGKAAPIEAIPLELREGSDPEVRDKDCQFVLYTNLTEVAGAGAPEIIIPRPEAVELGGVSDPRAIPADYHSATVTYRMVRPEDIANWTSGLVSAHAQLPEQTLVAQLMDQVANRVANELRTPHSEAPQ